jgi:hypothetical protein
LGGFGSGDQKVLATFDAYVGGLDAEVVDVQADGEPRGDGCNAIDGWFEDGPELEGGSGAAGCYAPGGIDGAGQRI